MRPDRALRIGAALLWGAAAMLLGGAELASQASRPADEIASFRARFRRPDSIPHPVSNPGTPETVALGRDLFGDPRLSGSGQVSCATCHQPELSFSDGVARREGLLGEKLPRRTPPLWNLAFGETFFWDGRAASLEDQAAFPVANPHEMGGDMGASVRALASDPVMAARFRAAFPGETDPVTPRTVTRALAAFERTLVSPETRFDAWVRGDDGALQPEELTGLRLFVGKAGCIACHTGWRFTDEAFHDIGLPLANPPDPGRAAILGGKAGLYAFKTPSLRERVWSAPYMHDGSIATLDEVVAHYGAGTRIVRRPGLSADLDPRLVLDAQEQAQLVAFLATLSGEDPPRTASLPARVQESGSPAGASVAAARVGQKNRRFAPDSVRLAPGDALTIVNDDSRTHNVMVTDPRIAFTSDAQEPGDQVVIRFPEAGSFMVVCGIHPEMKLAVSVQK